MNAATKFYTNAFGLKIGRRIGDKIVELLGLASPIYLLEKHEGSKPFSGADYGRTYQRHWSPIHLDLVVDSIERSIEIAKAAGANLEIDVQVASWGKLALFSDPFGNGFCLVEFIGKGYDEIR